MGLYLVTVFQVLWVRLYGWSVEGWAGSGVDDEMAYVVKCEVGCG